MRIENSTFNRLETDLLSEQSKMIDVCFSDVGPVSVNLPAMGKEAWLTGRNSIKHPSCPSPLSESAQVLSLA